MSADTSANLVLGFEVTQTTFFTTRSTGIKCPNGHRPKEGAGKFCDSCGGKFQDTVEECATPDFAALAKRLGYSATDLWDGLVDEGVYSEKRVPKLFNELGIHYVGCITSSEHQGTAMALGFRLAHQASEGSGGDRPNSYDLVNLNVRAEFLNSLAKELKVEFLLPVKLFLSIDWSV